MYNYMTSYSYITMITFDSCMIWFHFDCIMQLKKSYYIATDVCGRKSATTFGDLHDWFNRRVGTNFLTFARVAVNCTLRVR